MALLVCPDCKKKVSETAASCPKCGFSLTPDAVKTIKKNEEGAGQALGCIMLLAVVGFGVWKLVSPGPVPPPPVPQQTEEQKAAEKAEYERKQAFLQSNLEKATPTQVRNIIAKCRGMVDDMAAKEKVISAMVVDENAPDSYQALAAISNGSYRSIDERVSEFLKIRKGKEANLGAYLRLGLGFTIISTEATFTAPKLVPRNHYCGLSPDLKVEPPY